MRVGIDLLSEKGVPGGIHTYSNRLLEGMAEAAAAGEAGPSGLELVVLLNDDFQWLFPAGAHPALRLVSSGRRGMGAAARRLLQQTLVPRLARRERLDLIHSVNNVLPLRGAVPGVVTVHDLSAFALPARFGLPKRCFLRWAAARSIRRAERVISVSESTRRELLRWISGADPERITVIGEGAEPGFSPEGDAQEEARLRSRHRLPESFILSVGGFEPGKNLAGIAAALAILEAQSFRPDWVLAGFPPEEGSGLLRSLAPLVRKRVHLLGVVPRSDLPHLFRMASLFLFPSLHEGFGLPLLEALASGAPAITSRSSSLPEVAGRAALLVDPRDPAAIARAVRRLWERPRLREILKRRGPLQAARFSWRDAASRTIEVYREALGARPLRTADRP